MNTHESYVSLETAKLLKQIGFDWDVTTHYSQCTDEEMVTNPPPYPIPTLAVAQKWLREVKGINISVLYKGFYISNNIARFEWDVLFEKMIPEVLGFRNVTKLETSIFSSYEEALEAGIKKALELILEKGE